MRPFQLVASDIDGTLIRDDGTLSSDTLDVIHALPVPFVLVTGRPVRWLRQLYDQMPEPVPAVCANGAVVYDPVADKVLRASPLATDLLIDVTKRLREAIPDIVLAVEVDDGRRFWHEEAWPMRWAGDADAVRVLSGLEELTSVPAVKLLVRSANHTADEFHQLVSGLLGESATVTHSSRSALVEISAAGVTKAAGLAWLCSLSGIEADGVLAFGDMPNDIPLLTWAGHSVAMGNAHPAVRAAADEVGPTNEEDGVARYLRDAFGL